MNNEIFPPLRNSKGKQRSNMSSAMALWSHTRAKGRRSKCGAWCWCSPSVILATQEAEIRRLPVQNQANSLGDPILKKKNHRKGLLE
jgi:hypothetical protein